MKRIANLLILFLAFCAPLGAQNNRVQYFYDDSGRLIRVVDPSGNVATYNYDPAGNLLSISRTTTPANNGLAILGFTPLKGTVGQSVVIQGQGFSSTASANTVQFNGAPAIVSSATATALSVAVPSGASTGPISVTVGGVTATSDTNFTVVAPTLVSIAVGPSTLGIGPGNTQQFTATGTFNDGSTQNLTTAVTWSSSNTSVATASNAAGSQGQVATVAKGFSVIVATSGAVSGSAALYVRSLVSLGITPTNAAVLKGSTQQFTAQARYDDGTSSNVTESTTWGTSDATIATMSNASGTQGLATTVGNGNASISATFGGTTSFASLVVNSLTSITVTPAGPSIAKGSTQQFIATGAYTDGSTKNLSSAVMWSSSNGSVALIGNVAGSQGLVRTLGAGTTAIAATSGTVSGSTTLTVTGPTPVSLAVTPGTPFIPLGSNQQFLAVLNFTDGSTQDVTSSASWSSSAPSVATVNSQGLATSVAIGATTITATSNGFTANASLSVANSVVTGTVTFSDGSPVPFPDVFVTQADSQGNLSTFFTSSTDQNGNYWVTDVSLGSFNVIAQDFESGLNASAGGTLAAATTPASVNIQLPPGGSISGTFRDSTGAPVANAGVQVFPAGAILSASFAAPYSIFFPSSNTTTNSQGFYTFNKVAAGEVVVIGSPEPVIGVPALDFSNSAYVGATKGNLSDGQSLTLDITLAPTSTIIGTVFASDGVTPLANANVFAVENTGVAGGFGDFFANILFGNGFLAQADTSGNFRIDGIPTGTVNVVAADSNFDVVSGLATGSLTSSNALTLNPVLGNAVFINDNYNLTDPNGFVYDIVCNGEVASGGQGNGFFPFRFAADMLLNENDIFDSYFCGNGAYGTLDQAGRQLTLGPRPDGTGHLLLQIQRKIFVPSTGGFARYVDSFTNPLDVPISTNVLITNGFSSPAPNTVLAGPQTNGNTFVVLQNSAQPLSPILGFVFAGNNTSVAANFFNNLNPPNCCATPTVDYQWNQGGSVPEFSGSITIGAHQTVSLMHFVIQWNNQDPAGAVAKAQALANLTDPNALVGLSAQEKSQVVNFNVP